MRIIISSIILLLPLICFAGNAQPIFMSIKSSEVNARKGPGVNYPIIFNYEYKWLPVRIIGKYDNWRKIKDVDGDESWIHLSFLSKKRTVIVNSKSPIYMYKSNSTSSMIAAKLMPNVVLALKSCSKSWCKVTAKNVKGYVQQSEIWGILENEEI